MIAGIGVLGWLLLAAPSAEAVEAALGRVVAAGDYQTELPLETEAVPQAPRRRTEPARTPPPAPRTGPGLRTFGQLLWWLLVGVLVILALAWAAREWSERRRLAAGRAAPAAPSSVPAPGASPEPAAADPEALAAEGRYADAIHALLLALLARHGGLRPAWTSREALRRLRLGDEGRKALAGVVALVERTRFGGRRAERADYERARAWREAVA